MAASSKSKDVENVSSAGLSMVPNELLEQILESISSLQLVRLSRTSRRFYATARLILLNRIGRTFTSLHGHNLIFECFPPELKSSTPYYHCEYVRTDVLDEVTAQSIVSPTTGMAATSDSAALVSDTDFLPGCYSWRADDFLPGCSPWYDFLPNASNGKHQRLSELYCMFRPRLPYDSRNVGPSSTSPLAIPSANVKLEPEANFAKLSSSASLVKIDSRKSDRLTNITTIFESNKRLNRTFLQDVAAEGRRAAVAAKRVARAEYTQGSGKSKTTQAASVEDASEEKDDAAISVGLSSERALALDHENKILLKVSISQKTWRLNEQQRQSMYQTNGTCEAQGNVLLEEVEDDSASAATYMIEYKELAIQALYILVAIEQSERSNIIHIPMAMVAT